MRNGVWGIWYYWPYFHRLMARFSSSVVSITQAPDLTSLWQTRSLTTTLPGSFFRNQVHPNENPKILGPRWQYWFNCTAEITAIALVFHLKNGGLCNWQHYSKDNVDFSYSKSSIGPIYNDLSTDIYNILRLTKSSSHPTALKFMIIIICP
jgi:hypothetical protein